MKMMKITITIFLAAMISIAGIKAQTLQEGINHLYADRDKTAKETFEKLIATNPNNLDAIYWLGQAHIAMSNVAAAKDLYSKTLNTNGNAPLILVGMGHVELINGNKDKARQLFESAITISTGKKGVDANVLNAIGRAHVDAKEGDVAYAIEKLKLATEKDSKNPDIFLNLGDAYRKAHEGGQAVVNYDKAIQANPAFARAAFRKGMIYYTQKNWELFEQLMNQSVTMDPKFAPAYYQLYYYYLYKLDFAKAEEYSKKYLDPSVTDPDPQNDYLRIQTIWAQKKYDEAITGARALIAAVGQQAKPRVYKLLADAYVSKGDTAGAKQYIDEYFAKAKEEEIQPGDYILRGQIYGGANGNDNIVLESFIKAAQMDSVYSSRMETLQKGVDYFEKNKKWCPAAEMRIVQTRSRKTPGITDPFFIGYRFYLCGAYQRADSALKVYTTLAPDTVIGHYLRAQTNFALDTTMMVEPYASTMMQEYQKTLDLAQIDKMKFKPQAIVSSKLLAGYFNNIKKNKDSAIFYLQKGLEFDTANISVKELIKILQTSPARPPRSGKTTGAVKPAASASKPLAIKTKTKIVAKS